MYQKPGFTWGNTYEYCWMKGHIQLSEEANGKRIVMNLKPDGEATLFVNDKALPKQTALFLPHQVRAVHLCEMPPIESHQVADKNHL